MRIGVVSLNVDGLKKSPGTPIPDIFSEPLDYYVEFTQEDARPITTPPLIGTVPQEFTLLAEHSMNDSTEYIVSKQNILTKVYTSKKGTPVITRGTIPLSIRDTAKYKLLLPLQRFVNKVTKGAVWIHIKYNAYSLLFINLHLPVLTKTEKNGTTLKDPTLGYDYRKSALLHIFKELKELIDTTTFTVVGGDLNFRINPDGKDQLETLLQENTYMKEFPFPDEASKTYTCKFIAHKKNNGTEEGTEEYKGTEESLESCRLTPIQTITGPKECHDTKRIASRCDRFLYHGQVEPIVEKQESLVYLNTSDHNALYLIFTLSGARFNTYSANTRYLTGGKKQNRTYKKKSYKKKTYRKKTMKH